MYRSIDHIVYGVPDIGKEIDHLHSKLGIRPVLGGKHITKGTKNALVSLGDRCYLEILARDEENKDFVGERWMGMDRITRPKIIRWSVGSSDLKKDSEILQSYDTDYARVERGSREIKNQQQLQWQMILPVDKPMIDVVPFVTDWSDSAGHPAESLEKSCVLKKLILYFPTNKSIEKLLGALQVKVEIITSDEIRIEALIETPKGIVVLS